MQIKHFPGLRDLQRCHPTSAPGLLRASSLPAGLKPPAKGSASCKAPRQLTQPHGRPITCSVLRLCCHTDTESWLAARPPPSHTIRQCSSGCRAPSTSELSHMQGCSTITSAKAPIPAALPSLPDQGGPQTLPKGWGTRCAQPSGAENPSRCPSAASRQKQRSMHPTSCRRIQWRRLQVTMQGRFS